MSETTLWLHGNAVRPEWVGENLARVVGGRWDETAGEVPWSDVHGLPRGWGTTYRGRASHVDTAGAPDAVVEPKAYWFHYALPTPTRVQGHPTALRRVCALWRTSADVEAVALHVYDGGRRIAEFPILAEDGGRNGLGGDDDLVDGVTSFELPAPRAIQFGLGLSLAFRFHADGDVTFFGAGATFG